MSRKRKQSKRPTAPVPVEVEAVPEEILAEGSEPVESVDAGALAEAAKAVGRRGKKRRAPARDQEASTEPAPADQSDEVSAADEESTSNGAAVEAAGEAAGEAAEARPRRRRRRGRVDEDGTSNGAGAGVEAAGNPGATAKAVAEDELRADADADVEDAEDAEADAAADSDVDDEDDADDAERDAAELDAAAEADEPDVAELSAESAELESADSEEADEEQGDEPGDELRAADGEGADGEGAASDDANGEALGDEDAGELGAVLPTSAASMDAVQLKHLVEALIFASDKPLTVARLRQLTRVSDTKRLEQALADITEDFRERGIILQQISGGYQFRTRTQYSSWVQQLIAGRPVRLSRAQLETLAIIAYRQPITRPEIDDIRGVDSTATLKLLIDRALIRTLGKKEEVGRPMLYGTTKEFLDFFSLGDLRELPTLREYSELTDESRKVMSARLGIDLEDTTPAPSSGGDDDGGSNDGGGGGSGGGDGGGGVDSGGFNPESFDSGETPDVNAVDIGASAGDSDSDMAADSAPIFDESHDALAEQTAPAASDGSDGSDDAQAAHEDAEAAAAPEPEVASHVGAAGASDVTLPVEASSEAEAASHVGEAEAEAASHVGEAEAEAASHVGAPEAEAASHVGAPEAEAASHVGAPEAEVSVEAAELPLEATEAESPVEAIEAELSLEATEAASRVGALEIEDAGVQVEASSWDEAASHVGSSSAVDPQEADGWDAGAPDVEAVADSAVMEGFEWPEGSGRVGEASEAGLESAIALTPAPVEVTATDDVDAAAVADSALIAEQRTTKSAHEPTQE